MQQLRAVWRCFPAILWSALCSLQELGGPLLQQSRCTFRRMVLPKHVSCQMQP